MILASASPRRLELLRTCGFTVCVHPANIDESYHEDETPNSLVKRIATEKAHAAARELDVLDDLLVAADTIVWDDNGDVLGKPRDEADACRMLTLLSGRTHHVTTGVCVMAPTSSRAGEISFAETTHVMFHPLSEDEIAAYVSSGEPMDKAGAYGIQGYGCALVRMIKGDYLNVVGLPVSRLLREINRLGLGESYVKRVLGGNNA
ncbi:MAG: septum formation protein Maf [Atopobiaceae bacterium]|nr:septum formation protein Maf [Atopobiaceae bacterium]